MYRSVCCYTELSREIVFRRQEPLLNIMVTHADKREAY